MTRTPTPSRPASGALGATDAIVLGLFFLSGASALVYEVVWGRLLTFIFGGTAFAIATVLAAYMAGLALGSWVFGRRIDRGGHPLVVYGLLEAGIAVWALLLPLVLAGLNSFYGFLYRSLHPGAYPLSLIRFLLSFLVLLVPTILMGGTLPVLSKLLVGARRTVGLKTGLLYGTNTVGAVAGTAAAGFFLIPALGMHLATWVAVAFNLLVAALAVLLRGMVRRETPAGAGAAPAEQKEEPEAAEARRLKRTVLFVYAASGYAALTYEVAWTKVLSGALGTTTYAFSAMLTTFLLGLAIGAFIMARLADRHDPAQLLAWSQLGIAVLGLASLPVFGNLPLLYVQVYKSWGPAWGVQTLAKFALCALTMLPPTILMGGAFPLVARVYADRIGRMGKQVGELYASNTIGAILGSFLAGFVLIPLLGRQNTILVAVAVNIVSAAALYRILGPRLGRKARLAAALTGILVLPLLIFGGRPWDRKVSASGAYVYADYLARQPDIRKAMHDQQLIYYHEETEGILSVWRSEHVLSLRTNGKVEASTSGDMITQKMISHLPLLHHRKPDDVLMIGLASGISMGSVMVYPEVKKADCVEMLGGMTRVSDLFRKYNHDCLRDPRTHLIINDGRNHLLLTRDAYDVIISQPSNPWIVGIGSLFTREFFALGASRLKPGGIFCQWVQMYQMSRADFGSVLVTFHEVFPHVTVWMGSPGDIILLGSREPLVLDYARLDREIRIPGVAEDLKQVGVLDAAALVQGYLGSEGAYRSLTSVAGPVITDNNLRLEFSMPKNLYAPHVEMMDVSLLGPVREPYTTTVKTDGLPADSAAQVGRRLADYFNGRGQALAGISLNLGARHAEAVKVLEDARTLAPSDPLVAQYLGSSLNEVGIKLMQGGQEQQALAEFRRAAQWGSRAERALALNNIGLHYFGAGRPDTAAVLWQEAADLEPESPVIRFNLALVYDGQRRPDLAEREYRAAVGLEPDNAAALNNLAWILAQNEATAAEATTFARRAVAIDPSSGNLDTYGWALYRSGKLTEAEKTLRKAVSAAPDNMESLFHLGSVLADAGRKAEARSALERVVQAGGESDIGRRARQKLETL